MNKITFFIVGLALITVSACTDNDFDNNGVEIPNFNFSKTIVFEDSLSTYNIFTGKMSELNPSEGFEELALSSVLFTDFAEKQRLVKIPPGKKMIKSPDGSIQFPDGTVLTKTFFYADDERDPSLGRRIIETRLLIKESSTWNVATYVWNQEQTAATLELNGITTQVSWINEAGANKTISYKVPTENQCMTCHQSNGTMSHLGPTLTNLNREVEKDSQQVNQISHLQRIGFMEDFDLAEVPSMVNYKDGQASLSDRGRAYLAMNCAHCHNPKAWDTPAGKDLDFRYNTAFGQTGISDAKDRIIRNVMDGDMPFIGTTVMDHTGVALIVEYIESL